MIKATHPAAAYVKEGTAPLILTFPHTSTYLPSSVLNALTEKGKALEDTDWYVDKLYEGLHPDITIVQAQFHRYLIDANRPPTDEALYEQYNNTSLCPLTTFRGEKLYKEDSPNEEALRFRKRHFHAPYHQAITYQIHRLKQHHPRLLLLDCHSIKSHLPYLFQGKIAAVNLGSYHGKSCSTDIVSFVREGFSGEEVVTNKRFHGGYTIRHYGTPSHGIEALQIELAQRLYLEEDTHAYRKEAFEALRKRLGSLLAGLLDLLGTTGGGR